MKMSTLKLVGQERSTLDSACVVVAERLYSSSLLQVYSRAKGGASLSHVVIDH